MKIISLFSGLLSLSPAFVQEVMKIGFHFFFSFLVAWPPCLERLSKVFSWNICCCHLLLQPESREGDSSSLQLCWKAGQPLSSDPQRWLWLLRWDFFSPLGEEHQLGGRRTTAGGLSSGLVWAAGKLTFLQPWLSFAPGHRICLHFQ